MWKVTVCEASLLVLFPHLNWQQWCSRRAETLRSTGHDFTSREHPEARHPVASLDQLPRKRPGLQEVGQNLQSWTKWHQSQGWHDSPQIAAVASHFQVLLHQRVAEVWRLVVAKKAPKDFFWGTGVTHVTPCCPSSCHSKTAEGFPDSPTKNYPSKSPLVIAPASSWATQFLWLAVQRPTNLVPAQILPMPQRACNLLVSARRALLYSRSKCHSTNQVPSICWWFLCQWHQ